ncbi:unnamed protein product, partial [Brenthis ino]
MNIFQAFAASFYDNLRGAMSNVERGFEKLITDVVTDVADTVHCTLSAVEQVLVLKGVLDKTSAYNYRCKGLPHHTVSPISFTDRGFRSPLDKFKSHNVPSQRDLFTRNISMELGRSLANTNKTINHILKQPIHMDRHKSKILHDNTRRLVEISDLLKKEVAKLSNNTRIKIENVFYNRRNSVESLWGKNKTLHDIQYNSNNPSEIKEIRNVLDTVVNKFDLPSDSHKATGNYDMDDIKKQLERFSTTNINHRQIDDRLTQEFGVHDPPHRGSTVNAVPKTFKEATSQIINHNNAGRKKSNSNPVNSEKSVFNFDMTSLDNFSPFSNAGSNHKESIDNARTLIQESQRTDKALNNLFQTHKVGADLFSNSNFFNFR